MLAAEAAYCAMEDELREYLNSYEKCRRDGVNAYFMKAYRENQYRLRKTAAAHDRGTPSPDIHLPPSSMACHLPFRMVMR